MRDTGNSAASKVWEKRGGCYLILFSAPSLPCSLLIVFFYGFSCAKFFASTCFGLVVDGIYAGAPIQRPARRMQRGNKWATITRPV